MGSIGAVGTEPAGIVTDPEQAVSAAQQAASAAHVELSDAQASVAALEERVAQGHDVSFAELGEARHRQLTAEVRVRRADEHAQAASSAAWESRAQAAAASWDSTAPAMRAAIRQAGDDLAAARDALFAACGVHNTQAASTQRRLAQLHRPGITREPARQIEPRQLLATLFAPDRPAAASAVLGLPSDVIPDAAPKGRTWASGPPEPASPVRSTRPQPSPFGPQPTPEGWDVDASGGARAPVPEPEEPRPGRTRRSPFFARGN